MMSSQEEERLQWSCNLVADIYQELSLGHDPMSRLICERAAVGQDRERQEFFGRVIWALGMETVDPHRKRKGEVEV